MNASPRLACLLAVGFIAAVGLPAHAATVDLSWDQCLGASGSPVVDRASAGPGTYTIALTGRQMIGRIAGTRFVFEVRRPGGLPDAWRFDAAGCASGKVQVVANTVSKSCPAIGALPSTSATMTLDPSGQAGTLTVLVFYNSGSTDLQTSSTYSLGRVLLDFDGDCAEIDQPVCVSLVEATFLPGEGGEENFARGQAFLTWNDGAGATACSARTLRGIAVEEFMTACSSFDLQKQFVELSAPPTGFVLPGELRMRVEDRNGVVLSDGDVVTPGRVGEPWPAGGSWLAATPSFETGSGLQADLELSPLLDPDAGRIVLYDARPGGPVLQNLAYGPDATVPAPLRGQSRVRTVQGSYEESTTPDPRSYLGATTGFIACTQPPDPPLPPSSAVFRISEIGFACFSGHPQGQFVELQSLNDSSWTGPLTLELLDGQGVVLAQKAGIFGATSGTITPHPKRWLVTSPTFYDSFETGSVPPDQTWDFFPAMPVHTFRLRSPHYGTIDQVTIGGASPIARPPHGASVAFTGGAFTYGSPTPTNYFGTTLGSTLCLPAALGPLDGPCPWARVRLGLPSSNALNFWTQRAALDTTRNSLRLEFDRLQPRIHFKATSFYNPVIMLDDEFTLVGGVPGEEVEILAHFHAVGGSGGGCTPTHGCSSASAGISWAGPDTTGGVNLGANFDRFVSVPIRVRVGEPFPFQWSFGMGTSGFSSISADFAATLRFANLPPGMHVESCMGYFDDTPVAALPSIVSALSQDGVVILEWSSAAHEVTDLAVERRAADTEWAVIGTPDADRTRIVFEDRSVTAGMRYAYRLRWTDEAGTHSTEEIWVDGPDALRFTARLPAGAVVRGPITLALTLPSDAEVTLDVFGISGRRLDGTRWQPRGGGATSFDFRSQRRLAPGVYWIRLRQGAQESTLRAIVLDGR